MVIILNYNGYADTVECLDSLKNIEYPNYDIFVVDNGSKTFDDNNIIKIYPSVRVVCLPVNLGFTGGNNFLLDLVPYSDYDYVLLLNNDTVVSWDFLSYLVNTAESDTRIGIVSPLIFYYNVMDGWSDFYDDGGQGHAKIWYNGGNVNKWTGITRHDQTFHCKPVHDTGYANGCCMLIKRELIEKNGGLYNGYFAYYEDLDYSYRAKAAGYRIVVDQRAQIYHKVSATAKKSNVGRFYYIRNRLLYMKRNSTLLEYSVFLPVFLLSYVLPRLLLYPGITAKAIIEGFN